MPPQIGDAGGKGDLLGPGFGVSLEGPIPLGPDVLLWARNRLRVSSGEDLTAFGEVEKVLVRCVGPDPRGERYALLGVAQFLQERYTEAARNLSDACSSDPTNEHWRHLLTHVERNLLTRFDLAPHTKGFDREALLAPPALQLIAPSGLEPPSDGPGLSHRLLRALNDVVGAAAALLLGLVVRFVGRGGSERTWVQWPKDQSFLLRDLRLAWIRDYMNRNTLQDPYAGHLVGFQTPGQKRPEWTERYRTATGAWNTDNPMEGAAGTLFIWQGKDPVETIRRDSLDDNSLPPPISVANAIFRCEGKQQTVPFLNLLTVGWIQFMVHDWLNHRQSADTKGMIPVRIPENDPRREKYEQDYMFLRRTEPSPTGGPLAFENEVTAWWDGSQIYGSDQGTQDRLRTDPNVSDPLRAKRPLLADGKLYVTGNNTLPLNRESRVIDSGFTRNMWVGLELFHTLFVRHHNYLCDEYRKEHPSWSSDQIFNHARLENAATMAKIHTIEWTPAVLPTRELAVGMSTNWHGMLETLSKPFERRRPLGRFDPTNPVLGGVVGGITNNFGVPQNFSEQFAEVYRLHSAIPDAIEIRSVGRDVTVEVQTDVTRAAGSHQTLVQHGLATLFNSFGWQHMPALVNNNHPRFMFAMSTEGAPLMDLAATDIVRARERGVPPFNRFRQQLGMPPIKRFEDLKCDAETVARLKLLYGGDVTAIERMDLAVGMHCDMDRPLKGFDNTRFAVFLQAATRRLQTDPFYTAKYNERYYTAAGLRRIDAATMKSLLLLHCPELERSGLAGVNNAFEPWGTTADVCPSEHPLTEYAERYVTKHPGRLT